VKTPTYLTVGQAATELGVCPSRVRALIASGRLAAEKFGPAWMIATADLASVRVRAPGRPWSKPAKRRHATR
jgi:excisionase family DNA binding protein